MNVNEDSCRNSIQSPVLDISAHGQDSVRACEFSHLFRRVMLLSRQRKISFSGGQADEGQAFLTTRRDSNRS